MAAGPADSRAAIVLAVVEDTAREVVADPVAVATVRVEGAGPAVEVTVRVVADPADGRADSGEEGRATTAVERSAASALTVSNTLITRTLTAFAGI